MRFEDFMKNGKVRKIEPDPNLARSLYQRAKEHLEFLSPLKIDKVSCASVLTLYYEALREIIEGFCEEDGYKVFSHEAFTSYLKEKGKEPEAETFDRMRRIRNGINYYGKEITATEVIQYKKDILMVINRLRKWKETKIIGLTGPNCAGKTTVADLLREQGFTAWSLSDAVRDEAKRRGLGIDRDTLIRVANDLRKHHGGGIFGQRMAMKVKEALAINPKQRFVIDSIRSPLEVVELRTLPEFRLWLIDAPAELRFRRAVERGRAEGATTLAEFQAKEAEEDTDDPEKQQLGNTFKLADQKLENIGTRAELPRAMHELLKH